MGAWCTEHIRSVHDLCQITTRELIKVSMYTAHITGLQLVLDMALQDSDVEGYYAFNDEVTIHSRVPVLGSYIFKDNCTYKVKWKPLFDD